MLNTGKSPAIIFFSARSRAVKTLLIFVLLSIVLTIISLKNFLLFHSVVELIGMFISFTIAIIAYNTYHITQKQRLTFLGACYFFICIINSFHLLTFEGLGIFSINTSDLSTYFSTASKLLESLSLLFIPLLFKSRKFSLIKPTTILSIYAFVSALLAVNAYFHVTFETRALGDTQFVFARQLHDLIITLIMLTTLVLLFSKKYIKNEKIFNYVILFVIIKIIAQLFFIYHNNSTDMYSSIGHILWLISFYFIYKALIETSLRRPVSILFTNLNDTNAELEKITMQLQETNQRLLRENMERRQTEQKLSQSKKRYKQLVELLPEALLLHCDGIITFANTSALKLFGASILEDIVGKHILDFIPENLHEASVRSMIDINDPGYLSHSDEKEFIRLDRTTIFTEVIAAPVTDNGKTSVMIIARDITERKKSEELKRSVYEKNVLLNKTIEMDRIKTEFFSNISHELRTPLNVILSTLKLSSKYLGNNFSVDYENKMTKNFGIMNQNCLRLLRLVNNLIDVTKIDAGYLKPYKQNCNIVSIIEDITLSVAQYVESKGISLLFDTDVEERILACDPEKIERIILNILSNATKFTNRGGSIFVNICDKETSIIVSVKDTGIGIPENKQSEIFDRFKQVDQSLTRNFEGSGIGLSLVKSLIEMHDGTITLESEPGKGSNFIIEIPVKLLEGDNSILADNKNNTQDSRVERIKVEFSDIYHNI
ncbi:MAG: ATP-binding protein [Clostridia bacterium]|nr:ATP-binding protein [Clostridia bacterium]